MGGRVFEAQAFETTVNDWTNREYLLLHNYRLGTPWEKAAEKVGMSLGTATKFWNSPKVVSWRLDQERKLRVKMKWETIEEVTEEFDKLYNQDEASRHKVDLLKEVMDRVWPKPSRNDPKNTQSPQIVINIDPESIQKAFDRQSAIDAQIVKEQAA